MFDVGVVGYRRVMEDLVPLLERDDPLETARTLTRISRHFQDQYERAAAGKRGAP